MYNSIYGLPDEVEDRRSNQSWPLRGISLNYSLAEVGDYLIHTGSTETFPSTATA